MPFKSSGTDGIFPALLQHEKETIIRPLNRIHKACVTFGCITKKWREVKVEFIPKPGKPNFTEAKSIRPISLTSFLLKTLENLCDRSISDGPLKRFPLSTYQHAYRPGRSCETALHQLVSRIEKSLFYKESNLALFLDIEGAFNKLQFEVVKRAAMEHGLQPSDHIYT